MPRNVNFVWKRSKNVLDADNRVTITEAQQFDTYSSSVLFNPLYNDLDMADYYCDVLVSGDEYVQSLNNTASVDIVVQGMYHLYLDVVVLKVYGYALMVKIDVIWK